MYILYDNKRIEGTYHKRFEEYFITKTGDVISFRATKSGRKLTSRINSYGYIQFKVENQWRSIHRMLAECFIPNPLNLPQINHKDGNKLNNNLDNLEWCTQQYNLKHAMDTGLHAAPPTPIIGEKVGTKEKIYFVSQSDAKRAGFNQPNINKCLKGERKTANGYKWRYA